jgi:hypothetical protein
MNKEHFDTELRSWVTKYREVLNKWGNISPIVWGEISKELYDRLHLANESDSHKD